MPYLATGTLHQRLQHGPLDPEEGGRIIEELASALTCAHNNGVIHRDVKPSNVLLDDQGHALLSDFSFARPQDASQNLTSSALIGTPTYMSPEQCRGDPIDVRSDQYSFAVMLYQMTTGQLPFEGETPMAIAIKHVSTPLPRPRKVNPNLPEGIELVLIRALAKDPALRFGSIEELNRAFQAALGTALDPRRRAAGAKTQNLENTLAMYRRYQNVKPPPRRRTFDRSAVVAALLLLTCTISSAAIAVIYPDLFATAKAAPPMAAGDIQATVDVVLTANAPAAGTVLPPGALETAVYEAVLQTLQASVTPEGEILGPLAMTRPFADAPCERDPGRYLHAAIGYADDCCDRNSIIHPAHKHFASAHKHFASAHKHLATSAHQHLTASAYQHLPAAGLRMGHQRGGYRGGRGVGRHHEQW